MYKKKSKAKKKGATVKTHPKKGAKTKKGGTTQRRSTRSVPQLSSQEIREALDNGSSDSDDYVPSAGEISENEPEENTQPSPENSDESDDTDNEVLGSEEDDEVMYVLY